MLLVFYGQIKSRYTSDLNVSTISKFMDIKCDQTSFKKERKICDWTRKVDKVMSVINAVVKCMCVCISWTMFTSGVLWLISKENCSKFSNAIKVFEEMPLRNVVSRWALFGALHPEFFFSALVNQTYTCLTIFQNQQGPAS